MILRIGAAGEDLVTIRRAPRPLYTTLFSRYNSAQYNSGVYVGSPKAAVKRPLPGSTRRRGDAVVGATVRARADNAK